MSKLVTAALLVLGFSSACFAQFSGPAAFSSAPSSQLGTVTNNLTITTNANGFVVSGQVIVAVPATATPIGGILATWTVDRPVTFPYGPANLTTTTVLDGFSAPPPGTVGSSTGFVESIITDYLGTTTSLSFINTALVAGVDTPPWINLSDTSPVFSHTSTPGQFLRQFFTLDGIYGPGPGGNWVIDVPVTTFITVVPEPSTFAMAGLAGVAAVGYGIRRRRRS